MPKKPLSEQVLLVTGASSGLGHHLDPASSDAPEGLTTIASMTLTWHCWN